MFRFVGRARSLARPLINYLRIPNLATSSGEPAALLAVLALSVC